MSEEKKFFHSTFGGFIIGLLIYAVMFFLIEVLHYTISSPENINPLRLPKLHLIALAGNIILFRFLIRKKETENTAKGILLVTFLYMLVYFIFINKIEHS